MKEKSLLSLLLCVLILTSLSKAQTAKNPIIFADVPDAAMIRVGDTYYMSSTTMHMSPGLPIMKSKDLVNWQLVSYAYDTLANMDELNLTNGKSTYGRGSWASSFRYHNGLFYVTTFAQTTGKTYIFTTKNIEKGPWKVTSFKPSYHDHTLFFDDDGKVYLIYGAGKIKMIELEADASAVKNGASEQVIVENASLPSGTGGGLPAEGSQLFKVNGKYYLFNISWPRGGMRTVIIHRADKITGPYEGRVALQDLGVAQGGLIDTPEGKWYSYLFRDYGAVGRIPYLVPVKWEDGWPILGNDGKVPETLDLPASKGLMPGIVTSDEFSRKKGEAALPLVWQWNHNPDPQLWSVTERKGFLRLKTARLDTSFVTARNTLTQRTIGPESSAATLVDISKMKEGDIAGLGLLQKNYGFAGVKVGNGTSSIVMVSSVTGKAEEIESVPITQNKVYLKAECDFKDKKDITNFFYSLDGKSWLPIGKPFKMSYTLPHFMGYRFGLFNYATQNIGGYADFDFFHLEGQKKKLIPVLIVDGFSNHDWKQTTAVTKWILEESGRFAVDVSTVPADSVERSVWNPDFSRYALIVQNTNNIQNPNLRWSKQAEKQMEDYVRNGGGLYILHSANNAFSHWKEYDKMIGLGWRRASEGYALEIDGAKNINRIAPDEGKGTGHGDRFNALIQVLTPHPINKGYPNQWQTANTEVYYFPRGPAENITVLSCAFDSTSTRRTWPVEWVVNYGKGRVYNSSLGHLWKGESYPPAYRCIGYQTTVIRAAEWLATGKVTFPVPSNFPTAVTQSLRPDDSFKTP